MTAASVRADLEQTARNLGFAGVAVARAAPLPETRQVFGERIAAGVFEGLPWLSRERAERATTPDRVLAGAQSVISLAAPYRATLSLQSSDIGDEPRGRVARYAWGRDYHRILEKKLRRLSGWLSERVPGSASRPLVDYGPLAERAYATHAGLGWTGKSTNLLIPGIGSWILLGDILTTIELEPDAPLRKACGACARCVAGCPTGAIATPYALDNRRCISFQTIEQRGSIPRALRPLLGDWLFGCDDCQDVCPVPTEHTVPPMPEFGAPNLDRAAPELLPLLALGPEAFVARFAGRPLMRAKRDGLLRNACVVLGNVADSAAVPALSAALADHSPLVRGHAAWALGRIGGARARALLDQARPREPEPAVQDELAHALEMPARDHSGYNPSRLAAWLRAERAATGNHVDEGVRPLPLYAGSGLPVWPHLPDRR